MESERIDGTYKRVKVFGGWLVEHYRHVDGLLLAMAFVPDPSHEWLTDAQNEVKEFFSEMGGGPDVLLLRTKMADLIDKADAEGVQLSLQDAYDMATKGDQT